MIVQNSTDFTGEQFGNYELEALLRQRTATDLYRARDVKLDQPVLVEVLRTPVSEDPELAGRFRRRMDTLSQIKEANIPPVVETGVTDDGYAYAVIDYVEGVWMSDVLDEWRAQGFLLPVGDALAFGREIATALSIGHSAGLVHHDLRPDNILISEATGRPILIDFGVPVTTNVRNGILSESRSDKLDYASPEELDGKATGRRSNIYSLGIMLYELLTGHRPELPTSSWDIFEHSTMPKEVPLEEAREGLSGETYRLVRNCLWRQEWSRFETAEEVISAIDTAILAEQAVPKAPIWSDGRSRWLYVAVPLLALGVLIVGLVLLWSQFASAEPQEGLGSPVALATEEGGFQEVDNPNSDPESAVAAVPTATITRQAPPTSVVDTKVPVFGPVSDQVFDRDEQISFAWIWLNEPQPGEFFTVYIEAEDVQMSPLAIGTVNEPDNASLYRLDTSAQELDLAPGSYLWQVRLENQESGDVVVESDARRFIIAAEPTATPTSTPSATAVPPTATATASPTPTPEPPTSTPVPPSATPTPVVQSCVPSRPPGWVDYRIQLGDTISFFAARSNVSVQTILDANCLQRGTVLSVGQLIYVPAPPVTPTFTPRPTLPPQPTFPPDTGGGGDSGGGDSGGGDSGGGGGNGGGGDGGGGEPEPTEPAVRPSKTPPPDPDE